MPGHPPILVIGPTTRCGTSLLQRLLNSTGKVVIYGENFALMQTVPDIIRGLQRGADTKRKVIGIARDMLVKRVDFEASSLFPDFDDNLAAWSAAFRRIVRLYEQDAAKLGFQRWGLKHQIRGQSSFALLPKLHAERALRHDLPGPDRRRAVGQGALAGRLQGARRLPAVRAQLARQRAHDARARRRQFPALSL